MCEDCKSRTQPIENAAEMIGHRPKYSGTGKVTDSYKCSCGWTSKEYWDKELAFDKWVEHAQTVIRRES